MNNVRCTGKPDRPPCGWQGDRPGSPTKLNGEIHWTILAIPDDPCPECGGRVGLIPQEEVPA